MPMHRIVDGFVFQSKPATDRRSITVHELGNGHREVIVQPVIEWEELGPLDPGSIKARVMRGEIDDPDADDKERANKLRAARRAKTASRRSIKVQGFDTLLTLTYRALQGDLDTCKRHFNLLCKRLRWLIPGFRYVAAFERQARGAWHVHIATHRLPAHFVRLGVKVKSWNVIRAVWREVIGGDGNIDVSRRSRMARKSPAKLAAYLSKYLLKDWDKVPKGTRRWQGSQADVPQPIRLEFAAASMADLIELAYAFGADGDCEVCTSWLSRFGDTFFLSSGPPVSSRRVVS
jgi:hypothetical protein